MKQFTVDQLNDLLNRACTLIDALEEYVKNDIEYWSSYTSKNVDAFFNEIDSMNEDTGPEYDSAGFTDEDRIVDGQYQVDPNWLFPGEPLHDDDPEDIDAAYEKYVADVKKNIDQATEEGILMKRDCSEGYSYLSKEGFLIRMATDPNFARAWGK
jgi:hypothetical protein